MEKTLFLSAAEKGRRWPCFLWRRGMILAGVALAALFAGLWAFGLPWWQSALWALALSVPIPLRIQTGERLGRALSRVFWAIGPLVGYCLVEILNWNHPVHSFTWMQIGLNLCFYYFIAFVIWLATGRRNLSCGIAAALFWAIGMANHYVIAFRGRTIFPGDLVTLGTALNVAGSYNYAFDADQMRATLVLALFLLMLLALPRQRGRTRPRLRCALPAAAVCIAFLGVFFATGFLSAVGIEPSLWTTRGNGFLLNFSVCLRFSSVPEPAGYSGEALKQIAGETQGKTKAVFGGMAESTKPVNLIVIMNESFADLGGTYDLETNQEVLPFFRSLTENTVRGTAYSSVFGGTTANSEFEFLTGNSMALLPAGAVPYHLYIKDGAESLAVQMNALGYESIASHPYYASGWNRVAVYRDFGFDRQLFLDDFQNPALLRDYISDRSDYDNLIRLVEEKKPGQPLFLFNVTMQNHSGYDGPWMNLPKKVWLTGARQGRYSTVDQYLNLAYQSDRALEYLINHFSAVEEPTMICFFGDHQPPVSSGFYENVVEGDDLTENQRKQEVPFLIWANYDIPEQQDMKISLNYLSTLLMETAGLPLTGYQSFLSEMRESIPVMNAMGYQDTSGVWHAQADTLNEEERAALEKYRFLQYNELFDRRENRLSDFFFLPEG